MSEDQSFFSQFTTKQFYVVVAIGLIIFATFAIFAYAAKDKLKSDSLTMEEQSKQILIQSFSQIGSFIGFLIALIPSVKILQREVQKKIPPN